jgi:hypothetical protein
MCNFKGEDAAECLVHNVPASSEALIQVSMYFLPLLRLSNGDAFNIQ